MPFLPVSKADLKQPLDIILVTGDAYIDHPSFGSPLIGRYLESHGFTVGIIAQPKTEADFKALGKPNLFFGVSSGNMDSMVANYTADKKVRRNDMYSPEGKAGCRPDRASIVYTNKLKSFFPDTPIVLGGVEASLRRFSHYDYWDNKVRRPLIFDAKADYLVYGMAEKGILGIAQNLCKPANKIRGLHPYEETETFSLRFPHIPNVAIIEKEISQYKNVLVLPSFEEVSSDKQKYAEAFKLYYLEGRKKHPRIIIQPYQGRYLVVFSPQNLDQAEFEGLFELPFMRAPHPMYKGKEIPAWDFVKFSTISHRGCFGGCSFCSISQHQGKYIVSRSIDSIKKEIKEKISIQPGFKGNILDVGGPTANMYGITCEKEEGCTRASCVQPDLCKNLKFSQKPSLKLMQELRNMSGIKHVFIASGIRYDLALQDDEYMEELVKYHVSGQMSVAPEHICEEVLLLMNKPDFSVYQDFKAKFDEINTKNNKKQFLVPYFIASHPGSTLSHALDLALLLRKNNMKIEQVQNFTPTPMTTATCMYYTGLDPFTGKKVHVPKEEERSFQRALLQPTLKNNYRQVVKALKLLNRLDLVKYLTYHNTNR